MKKLLIINSIVWAGLLIIGAYLFKDHENYKYLFSTIIISSGLLNALIYQEMKKGKKG